MPTNGEAPSGGDAQEAAAVLRVSRKEAIQKTIMSMTLGKDVSALFPDVLKNIATADLDQKKLVYLYLMYAQRAAPGPLHAADEAPGTTPSRTPTSASSP